MTLSSATNLLRVNSTVFGRLTIHHSNTGYEPNREMVMSGRFVPMVGIGDDDTHAQMLDIPVSANVSGGDLMHNVHSLYPRPNQTGKVYLQFLDFEKQFIWLHTEREKLSAKRLDVPFSINKGSFLLPRSGSETQYC